jgi:hypothetical protein
VELTDSERAVLEAIRFEFDGVRYRAADFELRPPTKAAYRAKRDKLDALKKAWIELDENTQWHLVSGLNAMWTGEAEDHRPAIAPVVDALLEMMTKSNGAPEKFVGLRRATALLWSSWCSVQLGGAVPIGREAVGAIGAEISALFDIPVPEAERCVNHALRDMEKDGSLPRRRTTKRD